MTGCLFVSDLHGNIERYRKLLRIIGREEPRAVFVGGDILPSLLQPPQPGHFSQGDFIEEYMIKEFGKLRDEMKEVYPTIFIIMGNDDGRFMEASLVEAEAHHLWQYIHMKRVVFGRFQVYGYSYVPPTPFFLKDWERYDVSRYVDPGCIAPEDGKHTIGVDARELKNATIKADLERLAEDNDLGTAIFLFHSPPYETNLDRAALAGKMVDRVPVDPHVGSIAIRRFVDARQPLLTLHGHVHESAGLTHSWRDRLGKTFAFSAAHDGPELAVVRFDLEDVGMASRELV